MRKHIVAALAVGSAALLTVTACSSDQTESLDDAKRQHVEQQQSIMNDIAREPASSETQTPETAAPPIPDLSPTFENEWVEQQLWDYMTYQGAKSLEGFSQGSPERNILAVTNPDDGVVRFVVRDLDYESEGWFLDGLAANYLLYTGCAADDVDSVIVETEGGNESVSRDHCG